MELNKRKVIDVKVGGVCMRDYPDFCDAHFEEAYFEDGTALTDLELEELTNVYSHVINEMAHDSLY